MVTFQIRYQKTVDGFVDSKNLSYTGTAYILTKNTAIVEKESIKKLLT